MIISINKFSESSTFLGVNYTELIRHVVSMFDDFLSTYEVIKKKSAAHYLQTLYKKFLIASSDCLLNLNESEKSASLIEQVC
jgi:hypothetical protein